MGADQFMDSAETVMSQADWIGSNCFWRDDATRDALDGGRHYELLRTRFPEKLLFITGFGNYSSGVSPSAKGEEYSQFYRELRVKPGIGAAFGQVLSAAGGRYPHLVWLPDSGSPSEISAVLGKEFQ
jgi:hypothetical protein